MPHVTFTFHQPELGGAVRSIMRAVPELEALGWRCSFYVPAPGALEDELLDRGADVAGARRDVGFTREWLRRGPDGLRKLGHTGRWLSGWRRFLRERRPDVVHSNSVWTLPEALVARGLGFPTVLHVHEMLPRSRWKATAVRATLPRLPGLQVVGCSQACAAAVAPGTPVVLESTTLSGELPDRTPGGPPVVGSMGALAPRKGTDVFLAAAREIRRRRPDVEVRLCGSPEGPDPDDPWVAGLLREAAAVGVEHRASVETFSEMATWDVAVITSRKDPFPLVVLEALASGLPVVGTAVDGIAEQLDGGRGVLVPAEDPGAVARAVLQLLEDPARRNALGEAGRAWVERTCTPDRQAAQLDAVLRRVSGLS